MHLNALEAHGKYIHCGKNVEETSAAVVART